MKYNDTVSYGPCVGQVIVGIAILNELGYIILQTVSIVLWFRLCVIESVLELSPTYWYQTQDRIEDRSYTPLRPVSTHNQHGS